jgi:hypothetical protein
MAIILDGTLGITTPGGDTSAVSYTIGSTTSAWNSSAPSLQITRSALSNLNTSNTYLSHNAYVNASSQNIYIGSDYASLYRQNSGIHYFYTAASGTAGGVISYTKSLEVGKGATLALEGATSYSGTGISFPATQVASSDANTLDDYEEGTFTITLERNSYTAGRFSGTAYYTKVGNWVYLNFIGGTDPSQMLQPGVSGGTYASNQSVAIVSTLPFTPKQSGGFRLAHTRTLSSPSTISICWIAGSTALYLNYAGSNNAYQPSNNVVSDSGQSDIVLSGTGSYQTT